MKVNNLLAISILILLSTLICLTQSLIPTPVPSLNGLYEFGVAVDKGSARGVVATRCGPAQFDCILAWLMDFSEYTTFTMFAMLVIDATTGKTTTVPIPGSPVGGVVGPMFSSLLDNDKRFYYSHFGATFYQFDALAMNFTFYQKTHVSMAMSMTLDDSGNLWAATYKSGLLKFNPKTNLLNDYGFVYNQTYETYPRSVASDDLGFIYMGIAFTKGQFVAFNPNTQQSYPLIDEASTEDGSGVLYRDLDGAVYGNAGTSPILYKMYNGSITANVKKAKTAKYYYSGSQDYVYRTFDSGNYLQVFDVVNKVFTIKQPNGTLLNREFTYSCRGANIMDMVASPDGNQLIGSTSFPMTMFSLNSNQHQQQIDNYPALDQWNSMKSAKYDKYIWIATYPEGRLLMYDPMKPYVYTVPGNNQSNPLFIGTSHPHVNRPSCALIHPNMEHVLMSGQPAYGKTGGGLLVWNRKLLTNTVLNHTQLLTYHSVHSMSAIHNSDTILCGTTTTPGSGGQKIATEAELFLFDLKTLTVLKRFKPFRNVNYYYELFNCPENNYVYGYTDLRVFFVYDPSTQSIIHNKTIDRVFVEQGPHSFVTHPQTGETLLSTSGGVYKINGTTFSFTKVFTPPKLSMFNAVILNDGFYYFRAGTKVYGYKLFNATTNPKVSQSVIFPHNSIGAVNRTELSCGTTRASTWVQQLFVILLLLNMLIIN